MHCSFLRTSQAHKLTVKGICEGWEAHLLEAGISEQHLKGTVTDIVPQVDGHIEHPQGLWGHRTGVEQELTGVIPATGSRLL